MNTALRTAVLLVAGVGSRLRPLTNNLPKALVPLGAESVLHRLVRQLQARGILRFVFATGYCEDALKSAVMPLGLDCVFCRNEEYATTQNSISLVKCAESLAGEPFVKLDGDLVVGDAVFDRLFEGHSPMIVGVDTSRKLDDEAMKAEIDENGVIRDFGKHLPRHRARAESIGIEILDAESGKEVLSRITTLMHGGQTQKYYEDIYAELIREGLLEPTAVDVAGLPWSEIDTLEDLELAKTLIASEAGSRTHA